MTHTFLDVDDYHRYHFPVGGTVKEVLRIAQDDAPGGVIVWDAAQGRYKELYSENLGWQSIETRGIVIMEPEAGGLLAIVPVGMCQVSSVNFEPSVVPGALVEKGDPLGYFLFGGSDIIMIFSEDAGFALTAEPGDHLIWGRRTEPSRSSKRSDGSKRRRAVWPGTRVEVLGRGAAKVSGVSGDMRKEYNGGGMARSARTENRPNVI